MNSPQKLAWIFTLAAAATSLHAQTPAPTVVMPKNIPPTLSQQVAHMEDQLKDWAQLHRYAADNAALPPVGNPSDPAQRPRRLLRRLHHRRLGPLGRHWNLLPRQTLHR